LSAKFLKRWRTIGGQLSAADKLSAERGQLSAKNIADMSAKFFVRQKVRQKVLSEDNVRRSRTNVRRSRTNSAARGQLSAARGQLSAARGQLSGNGGQVSANANIGH